MTQDEDVARFLFSLTPPTYAEARYTDWFKRYLQEQHDDQVKFSSAHYRAKLDDTKAALANMERLEPTLKKLADEEMARL